MTAPSSTFYVLTPDGTGRDEMPIVATYWEVGGSGALALFMEGRLVVAFAPGRWWRVRQATPDEDKEAL